MAELQGWLKLHRAIMVSSVFSNPKLLKFWIWCLCKASSKPHTERVGLQEVNLEKGQFVFGRFVAADELGMTNSSVYKYLKVLEKEQMIVVKSNNKFSLVSIVNWCLFQDKKDEEEQQNDNKETPKEQQSNTNKNVKNVKNGKNDKNKDNKEFSPPTIEDINSYIEEKELNVDGKRFLNYFTESGWVDKNGKEVKNWKLKILTWDSFRQGGIHNGTSKPHSTTTANTSKWGNLEGIIHL